MGNFKILLILAMSLAFACVTKVIQHPPPSPLVKILKDPTLWGKDYPAALAYLDSWNKIGKRIVAVFPNQLVGTTPYETREEADQKAKDLAQAMQRPQPRPNADFDELLDDARKTPPPFQTEGISVFPDDLSNRVAWTGPSIQFLAVQLTLDNVQERLGPPEKITRELVPSDIERRPVILTLYRYAGGAVVFAETDWAPRPGFVDRIIFDIPAVTAVVFK